MSKMLQNPRQASILLVISGSIAAVKSMDLIRQFKERGHSVTVVLTKGGEQFVTALSCASLSGNKVYQELFSVTDESEMGHIRLSRENDIIVVAPASANMMAKMAAGLADDLASTILLASNKPVMIAPAMNVMMWQHPATQRNVRQLLKDGVMVLGPSEGNLACGEQGEGRMVEPESIVTEVERVLSKRKLSIKTEKDSRPQLLRGLRALVTSGPTVEAIDPVRYIANRSSGKQGHAIATALAYEGAEVTLISGPTTLQDPAGVRVIKVESAREMLEASYKVLPVDVAVCAAAVSDWRVTEYQNQKIKKHEAEKGEVAPEDMVFTFMENPDILKCLSLHDNNRPKLVIGFAAETENVVKNGQAKLQRKGCDWMLANDVSGGGVFGEDRTTIHFITSKGIEHWPSSSKMVVAETLARKIAEHFKTKAQLKLLGEHV